jgi:thermitase
MRLGIAAVLAAGVFVTAAGAFTPSDPDGSHPAYSTLNLPAAWEVTTGSPNVVVAVVDSGIDPSHADLAGAVLPGYDFVDRDTDPADPPGGGHGTAVSGVAAARANNGVGGVGACFDCRVMPLRVLGRDNIALNTNTAAAIDFAVDHGAAVVNVSLYGEHSPTQLRDAVARARAAGVLVVAAAGN